MPYWHKAISIALFKNRIILFLRPHDYHCFTVGVFWQFSIVSSLSISNHPVLHLKIQNILSLWLSGTLWAWQTLSHLGWRHSTILPSVPIFSFKVLYDLFDVKIHQLGFNNSSKEVWLSCLSTLLSRNVSSFCLVLYFFFFFPPTVLITCLHCASSRAFLSCLPYPGNSFKNCNMESFFSDSYGEPSAILLYSCLSQDKDFWFWNGTSVQYFGKSCSFLVFCHYLFCWM